MKAPMYYSIKGIVILLLSLTLIEVCAAQGRPKATFTMPRSGDLIENRPEFPVVVQIDSLDKSGYYWVAIASITGQDTTWERVLKLYKLRNNKDQPISSEMAKLLSSWQIDLFWPKFYVPESPYEGKVFDGGTNPLKGMEPQPMLLLVLKVDDTLQSYFKRWLREGASGKGYPGISASRLSRDMILARCEIFFP